MSKWTSIRDDVESAASLAGNYFLPGSSIVSDNLVSKGSQKQLGSTLGQIAQFATGATGGGLGQGVTGIPSASDLGAGWTNLGNAAGNALGVGNVGTTVSNGFGSILGGAKAGVGGGLASGLDTSADGALGSGLSTTASGGLGSGLSTSGLPGLSGSGIASAGAAAGGSGMSSFTGANLLSNGLSAFLGTNANDEAKKQLLAGQQAAQAKLQPFTNDTFTPGDLTQDPGYQFQLQQGQGAINAKNAATGNYYSGGALKDAADYSANLASTTYNNAYQRWLTNRNANYGATQDSAGIDVGMGNTNATADVNNSNVLSQALSGVLGGGGFTNTGASSGNSLAQLLAQLSKSNNSNIFGNWGS